MVNIIILRGTIASPVSVKTTSNFKTMATFLLSVKKEFVGKNNTKKYDKFNCIAWGKVGTIICDNCQPGDTITVVGKLKKNEYKDRHGSTIETTEISVEKAYINFNARMANDGRDYAPANESELRKAMGDASDDYFFDPVSGMEESKEDFLKRVEGQDIFNGEF